MTTQKWNAEIGPRSNTMNVIKQRYCMPPEYGPPETVKGTTPCLKCKQPLKFTVTAKTGLTTGRCSTAGCLTWRE